MILTEELEAICKHVATSSQNIMVNACAGTGKSTMLRTVNEIFRKEPALYLVFNKDAKEEAEEKFPSTTKIKTFNGLGASAWGNHKPDPRKMFTFLSELIKELKGEDRKEASDNYWEIIEATRFAKNLGYIPEGKFSPARGLISRADLHKRLEAEPSTFIAQVIDTLLCRSIQAAFKGGIDFDDQIYMPTLFGGTFPRYPRVFVDECQDVNPVNLAMLKRLGKSWMGAVGDRAQGIYAFRGALPDGMDKVAEYITPQPFDLSISWRCPQAIVEAARWRAPQFKWNKPGGSYGKLTSLNANSIPDQSAIICRNNAPLFRLAFALIKHGRGVKVAGSDIGPRIKRLLSKLSKDENIPTAEALARIEAWQEAKLENCTNEKTILDTADCMRVFCSFGTTLSHAIVYADHLFKQTGSIQLTTGHKAKGKEWDTTYFLDPWLIGQEDQELNLRYVIQTRAAQACYEIDSRRIDVLRRNNG